MTSPKPALDDNKILVAMSGGVDSSLAAALLAEQGLTVVGLNLQLSNRSRTAAGGCDDREDAGRVAGQLGLTLHIENIAERFEEVVVRRFVDEYLSGKTPSPCVHCNRNLKLATLHRLADRFGARWLATGHYARTAFDLKTGRFNLLRGLDRQKDQSYFLSRLRQNDLERVRFPLGELTKEEVRQKARELGLPVADRIESQELCFVDDDRYREFVRRQAAGKIRPGEITDIDGQVLGSHQGIIDFTIGQRKGLGIATGSPQYVVAIDAPNARIIIGDQTDLLSGGLICERMNWIVPPELIADRPLLCRIRSKHRGAVCRIAPEDADFSSGRIVIRFDEPQSAVAPGQAAVLYEADRVVGGGWIAEPLKGDRPC